MTPSDLTTLLDHSADPAGAVSAAASALQAGELVAIPTETVYGLAADALDVEAVQRIFVAKGRPMTDPLIVHVADVGQVAALVADWPDAAASLADAFWPGPLTIVTRRNPALPSVLSAGLDTIAVRIPAHPVAEAVLRAAGVPLAAPSANRFGRVSPTDAGHVVAELDGRIAAVLDAGPTHLGVESTIVDVTGATPRMLRPGGVTLEMLRSVLGEVDHAERDSVAEGVAVESPGRLIAHYSPDTPVVLVDAAEGVIHELRSALRAAGVAAGVLDLGEDPADAARQLYARLRGLDAASEDLALVAPLAPAGLGRAVNDRLYRAAHGRVALDADTATVQRLVDLVGHPAEAP